MSGLTEILRAFCRSLPTLSDNEVNSLLTGVSGRGEFGPRLLKWLELSRSLFPEEVRIEYVESISDKGVDVYVEGQSSQTAVGFQIKSDRDAQDDNFIQKLKAQITDARAYPNLELYVIVLACSPKRFMKLQYVLTEELQHWQSGKPEILVLSPGRAAALWQRCETLLSDSDRKALLRDRTWNRFFADAGAPTREGEFLQEWMHLPPEERFLPPNSFKHIEASLRDCPLTVLTGPPTIGKTFTAVQLLWRHYAEGKPVEWIEPLGMGTATSIIPASEPTFGMKERTRQLGSRLGMRPPVPPLTRWEFIAVRLQPDSLILIEDPFGMTDADYDDSLHTYDFFDLEGCIQAICEGGRLANCRLVVTTRHGLLERWLAERRQGHENRGVPNGVNIIHLTPEDYQTYSTKAQSPLVQFSKKLLSAAGKVTNENLESIARFIGSRTRTPQEVQYVIGELSTTSDIKEVREALERGSVSTTERLRLYCRASTDAERLFLFLLMMTLQGEEHNDFHRVYDALHGSLALPSNSETEDYAARAKYWPLFYQIVYPDNRQPFFKRGVHLKASHASVGEAAKQEIGENGNGFLDRIAVVLIDQSLDIHERRMVARHLVDEHRVLSEASIQLLAEALPSLIEATYTLAFRSIVGAVMRQWRQLPEVIRTTFFETVQTGVPRLAAEVCEMLVYYPLPAEDVWRFYGLLMDQQPLMGVTEMTAIRHPWEYLVGNINNAPPSIVGSFDKMAQRDPSGFSYVMGKLASGYWEQFRPSWREAILSDHAANSRWEPVTAALTQIFYGLFSYEDQNPPAELLDQLYDNLTNPNSEFRAEAGAWTLVHWEHLPKIFQERLTMLFKTELEPRVLFKILQGGMGHEGDVHDIELASLAIDRGNDVMAASLLNVFGSKQRTEQSAKVDDLVARCKIKGGQYARAVLLEDTEANTIQFEPEIVRLAFVWKNVTDLTSSKKRSDENNARLLELIQQLSNEYRQYAYYIVAYHEKELPQEFKSLVASLIETGDLETVKTISDAREESEKDRGPNGSRALPGFPIGWFGPKLIS